MKPENMDKSIMQIITLISDEIPEDEDYDLFTEKNDFRKFIDSIQDIFDPSKTLRRNLQELGITIPAHLSNP
jgi:hypothetical protein